MCSSRYRWATPCKPLAHRNWKRTENGTYLCETCGQEHSELLDNKTGETIA